MAIVKMDKIQIVGLLSEREDILDSLMKLGALEISEISDLEEAGELLASDTKTAKSEHDHLTDSADISRAIHLASTYKTVKKPMFASKRKISFEEYEATVSMADDLNNKARLLSSKHLKIAALKSELLKKEIFIEQLEPWTGLDFDLRKLETETVKALPGSFRNREAAYAFEEVLAEELSLAHMEIFPDKDDLIPAFVIYHKEVEEEVLTFIKSSGFRVLQNPDTYARPKELYKELLAEIKTNRDKIAELEDECRELSENLDKFEILHDHYMILAEKAEKEARLLKTSYAFVARGWAPSHLVEPIQKALESRFLIAFSSREATVEDEFPVLFKNNPLVAPYEVVTEMFSPPSARDIDPNPVMAPFFLIFFSMMLGDAGYGLLLAIGAAVLLWGYKVSGNFRKMTMFIFHGSLASVIWGLLFGSFLGNFVDAVSSGKFSFPTLWFDPLTDPIKLMIWSIIFGGVHIFAALFTKAYILVKTGKWLEAVLDILPWIFLISGLGLLLGGPSIGIDFLADIGKYMALVSAGILVLFGGRDAKNPFMRIAKGLIGLYDITGYFSDLLSYTRILALSLATAVIAMVVNMLATIFGFGFAGIIIFIVA